MRICLISREYPPETGRGGIATYTYNLAHGLEAHGHEVHVIALAMERVQDYFDGKVHIHRIRSKISFPGVTKRIVWSEEVNKRLNKLDKFDIIEAPEWYGEGFTAAFLHRTSLLTRLHTPYYLANILDGHRSGVNSRCINFLEKTQTIYSTAITSPSKALQEKVAMSWGIKPSRIKVIRNGMQLDTIREKSKETKNPINPEYLVYVGRLEPRKGVHILAKALPKVLEKFPKLKMVFIGEDMYRNGTMKEMIQSINLKHSQNIIFTGVVSEETKFSIIKNARFVVLPSLWEAFGYTCLESMALGKAVIASKNSGFEEIIENNLSGYLVEPGSSEVLGNKIIECLEAEDELCRIEKNAVRRSEDFDIAKVSRETARYYEKVIVTIR